MNGSRARSWIVAAGVLAATWGGHAAEWHVSCDGSGSHTRLQAAIDAAHDGDTIRVAPCSVAPFAYREAVSIVGRRGLRVVGAAGAALPRIAGAAGGADCMLLRDVAGVTVAGLALTGCGGHGIAVERGDDVLLHELHVADAALAGIAARDRRLACGVRLQA